MAEIIGRAVVRPLREEKVGPVDMAFLIFVFGSSKVELYFWLSSEGELTVRSKAYERLVASG